MIWLDSTFIAFVPHTDQNTIIIACDYDIMLDIEDKHQPFYLFPSIDVLTLQS